MRAPSRAVSNIGQFTYCMIAEALDHEVGLASRLSATGRREYVTGIAVSSYFGVGNLATCLCGLHNLKL
jgi:hypothetical protein